MAYKKYSGADALGEVLYETDVIAFDTGRGVFFNPKDQSIYGSTPPTGGWPISWYQSASGTPVVLNQPGSIPYPVATSTTTTVNTPTATSPVTSSFNLSQLTSYIPNFLRNADGSLNWTYIGIGAGALYFLMRHKRGR